MADSIDRLRRALADHYRLERELGAGGMATVYLAHDLRHDREVAIKVLRPELAATLGPERFLQEIQIAARLTHPHILPLHDSGEAGGFLYYVMPFVDGESLRDKLTREGELPVVEVVRVLKEVTDALAYAHGRGVVHRDIKPENVMLAGRHALVTDFGVAKALHEATGRQKLTTAGFALGTPAYMAPEQAAADPHLDHRADLYAVGVMGYEMLTGRPPFTGTSPQMILAAQVTEPPRPVTDHRPAVPPVMATTIMRCLEKKPADRWQTAGELLGQLEVLASTPSGGVTPTATAPVTATTARALTPARTTIRRLTVAAAVLVLGVVGWWAFGGRARASNHQIERIAVLPIENATGDSAYDYLADGLTRELIAALTGAKVHVIGYRSVSRYRGRDLALARIAGELHVEAIAVGSILRAGDQVQVAVELTDPGTGENIWAQSYKAAANEVSGVSHRAAHGLAGAMHAPVDSTPEARLLVTTRVNPEAYAYYLRGKAEAESYTLDGFRRSVTDFERSAAIDSMFAPAWAGLGYALEIGADPGYGFIKAAEGHAGPRPRSIARWRSTPISASPTSPAR